MEESDYSDVVKWVNSVRADLGRPAISRLKPGAVGGFTSCPLAESIGADVGVSRNGVMRLSKMTHEKEPKTYRIRALPPFILRFISEFDRGRFPELERT